MRTLGITLTLGIGLLVSPLAADDGTNVWYGGGYYDRTIEQLRMLRRTPPFRAVGVAFAGQRVDSLPHEPFDQPLDWILTEASVIEIAKAVA